jgi:nucleoside-diphosphate-sugar epimerase
MQETVNQCGQRGARESVDAPAVLILGGQGYIGSALTDYLQDAGLTVCSVDVAAVGGSGTVPNRRRRYQELTAEDLSEFGSVVVLAGHSSVAACDREPVASFANNVAGFVELVHKLRGQKLIYASSISVYINTGVRPAEESDTLPAPVSSYDLHKQTIERYAALAYPYSYGLRFGTVCGPSPSLRTDLLLNSLVRSAIFSRQVQVANRQASRPLLGINDLCRAIELLLTRPVLPGCYNLASVNVTVGEVADYVAGRFGVPCVEVERLNRYDIRVDTGKFRTASGLEFRDTVVSLVEALHDWYASASATFSYPAGPGDLASGSTAAPVPEAVERAGVADGKR